jgi:hypothetical protein
LSSVARNFTSIQKTLYILQLKLNNNKYLTNNIKNLAPVGLQSYSKVKKNHIFLQQNVIKKNYIVGIDHLTREETNIPQEHRTK